MHYASGSPSDAENSFRMIDTRLSSLRATRAAAAVEGRSQSCSLLAGGRLRLDEFLTRSLRLQPPFPTRRGQTRWSTSSVLNGLGCVLGYNTAERPAVGQQYLAPRLLSPVRRQSRTPCPRTAVRVSHCSIVERLAVRRSAVSRPAVGRSRCKCLVVLVANVNDRA